MTLDHNNIFGHSDDFNQIFSSINLIQYINLLHRLSELHTTWQWIFIP